MGETTVVTTPVAPDATPVKVKKVKVAAEPKEPRFRKGLNSAEYTLKLAAMTQPVVPEGYIGMSELCKKGNELGIKTSRIVTAMGGDRADKEPWETGFQVVYVGGRKFGSPWILDAGFLKLLDPEYHKTVRAGRVAKPKAEGAVAGKKIKVKVATEAKPWTEEGTGLPSF